MVGPTRELAEIRGGRRPAGVPGGRQIGSISGDLQSSEAFGYIAALNALR